MSQRSTNQTSRPSDYFENVANFNAECHTWNLHIFLVLLIKELTGKGFIRVAHMHSLLVSFRDYVFSSGAPRQIEKVRKKKTKRSAGRVKCAPLHCSSSTAELEQISAAPSTLSLKVGKELSQSQEW